MLNIVVAISLNGVIGRQGKLPWNLPSDLRQFRDITIGHAVIMGRKTYESLPNRYRPLPNRENIVLSRKRDLIVPSGIVCRTLDQALSSALSIQRKYIIGGEEIFRQLLPITDQLIVTEVQIVIKNGDAFFPQIDSDDWQIVGQKAPKQEEGDEFPYAKKVYWRKRKT